MKSKFMLAGLAAILAVSVTSPSARAADPVTLKVWATDGDNNLYTKLAKEFGEVNKDVVIDLRVVPYRDLPNEALRAFATGRAPDLIAIDNPDFAMFSSRGALVDITDKVANSKVIDRKVFYPGPMASATWNGKLYGIPAATNTTALFYNKDMFKAAGIANPPATWDELLVAARKLTDPSKKVFGITFSARNDETGTFTLLPWIQMAGGSYKNVNVPGAVRALQIWKTILDEKLASQDILTMRQWDSTGTFNAGNAAMAISGPWELNRMAADAKFDWGVVLLPTATAGGVRSSAMGDFNWAIFASSKNQDAAFKAIEYIASQSHRIFPEFNVFPARSDTPLPPTGNARIDAAMQVFKDQLQYAQPRGPHPEWAKISQAISDAIQNVLTGKETPQVALDNAQKIIQGIVQ